MNWLKVTRVIRNVVWLAASGVGCYQVWYMYDRIGRLQMSAPQSASFAATNLVELMVVYIIARGLDTSLELRERALLEKR